MNEDFDKQKMMKILMNSNVMMILAELEEGEKDSTYLTEKLQISIDEINQRLSYLIKHCFVKIKQNGNTTIFNVDKVKLNEIMETDENFTNVVDGLTELDQYLN